MWGFDFGKQAEELKKQAEAAAASTSWAPTNLFNLDSIRQDDEKRSSPTTKRVPDFERPVVGGGGGTTNANNNNSLPPVTSSTVATTAVTPLKKKPVAPVGKLKVPVAKKSSSSSSSSSAAKSLSIPTVVVGPSSSSSLAAVATAAAAAVASISPLSIKSEEERFFLVADQSSSPSEKHTDATVAVSPTTTTVQEDNFVLLQQRQADATSLALSKDESEVGGGGAWNEDEENLDTVEINDDGEGGTPKPEPQSPAAHKPSSADVAALSSPQSADAAASLSSLSQPAPPLPPKQKPTSTTTSPAEKSIPVSEDDYAEEEDSDDDYAPPPPPGMEQQSMEETKSSNSLQAQSYTNEVKNGHGAADTSIESIHVGKIHEDGASLVVPPVLEEETPKAPTSSQVQGEGQQQSEKEETPKKKLLILCSNQSVNRKAFKLQENCFTILTARKIPYETIDGSDLRLKEWRNELMALSGSREYPQFFLLDVADGRTAFWGNYERFEFCNDEGTLFDELTGRRPTQLIVHEEDDQEEDGDHDDGGARTDDGPTGDEEAESVTVPKAPAVVVSETMLQQFSQQLKRIEENHQAEVAELDRKHEQEMQQALQYLNHDDCEAQMMKMEEALTAKLQKKEEQLHDLHKINEGYKLKLDALKREVEGTQALLEVKHTDISKVSALHNRDLKVLGQRMQDAEERANKSRLEIEQLKKHLEATKEELAASRKEHDDLKQRVKAVASELKDRRQECRDLSAQVEDLTNQKDRLQTDLDRFQSIVTSQDRNRSEKDEQIIELRGKLANTEVSLKKTEEQLKEVQAQNDKAMTEYKKKAQNSLALANSRTASAVQAKEEAEMEARAARITADSAMERSARAEIDKREALAEAKVYVADMEREKNQAVRELQQVKDDLESVKKQLLASQAQLQQANAVSEQLSEELGEMMAQFEAEQRRATSMQEELLQSHERAGKLRDDISILREQLADAEFLTVKETQKEALTEHQPKPPPQQQKGLMENGQQEKTANDSETIRILQQELKDSNAVIEDLKEALENAVEGHMYMDHQTAAHNATLSDHAVVESSSSTNGGGKEASPLFYAMEKHAELKTARNEINRLANLLSDVQAEKMEAVDAMENMRQRMEEAESRLKRYEKLGVAASSNHNNNRDLERANGPTTDVATPNSGAAAAAVNIEYLKNIMLRYLNAKTLSERKALVPVIGAVLCLTDDEQTKALRNLEESLSLGGVGSSLLESLSGGRGRLATKK